nr:MAG TPA: hypothetical protein [Caudoviricetes sp.]
MKYEGHRGRSPRGAFLVMNIFYSLFVYYA